MRIWTNTHKLKNINIFKLISQRKVVKHDVSTIKGKRDGRGCANSWQNVNQSNFPKGKISKLLLEKLLDSKILLLRLQYKVIGFKILLPLSLNSSGKTGNKMFNNRLITQLITIMK